MVNGVNGRYAPCLLSSTTPTRTRFGSLGMCRNSTQWHFVIWIDNFLFNDPLAQTNKEERMSMEKRTKWQIQCKQNQQGVKLNVVFTNFQMRFENFEDENVNHKHLFFFSPALAILCHLFYALRLPFYHFTISMEGCWAYGSCLRGSTC